MFKLTILDEYMKLWGKPQWVYMQSVEHLHAYDCHQNWAEPQATEVWHKEYTRASQASSSKHITQIELSYVTNLAGTSHNVYICILRTGQAEVDGKDGINRWTQFWHLLCQYGVPITATTELIEEA